MIRLMSVQDSSLRNIPARPCWLLFVRRWLPIGSQVSGGPECAGQWKRIFPGVRLRRNTRRYIKALYAVTDRACIFDAFKTSIVTGAEKTNYGESRYIDVYRRGL